MDQGRHFRQTSQSGECVWHTCSSESLRQPIVLTDSTSLVGFKLCLEFRAAFLCDTQFLLRRIGNPLGHQFATDRAQVFVNTNSFQDASALAG